MAKHKGNLYVLASEGQGAETQFEWFSSPDADAWTKGSGTNWPDTAFLTTTLTRRNNFDDDEGRILDMGNTLMMALHDNRAAGTGQFVRIYYSTNEGTTWTAGAVVPSGSGPKAFVRWRDPFSNPVADSPVLVTSDGVYRIDVAGTTFDEIVALSGDPNTGRWAFVAPNYRLYVPLGDGDIMPLFIPAPGVLVTDVVGPASKAHGQDGDGLPTAFQGHANFLMDLGNRWLIAPIAASLTSTSSAADSCTSTPSNAWSERQAIAVASETRTDTEPAPSSASRRCRASSPPISPQAIKCTAIVAHTSGAVCVSASPHSKRGSGKVVLGS